MQLNLNKIVEFWHIIWNFYKQYGRSFAWRNIDDPYKVLVSEIMLQQTQTYRVEPKYNAFIAEFPTFASLAQADLHHVLSLWQGLGYNRRGLYLYKIAQKVINEFDGRLPDSPDILINFPGVGKATASSICAFAFNKPTVFIETNIRSVFIHFFFPKEQKVDDKALMPLIEATLDRSKPREWYYALMDYGVMLKKLHTNPSRKSKHHTKQSKFEGSDRQIRGMIIKLLTEHLNMSFEELAKVLKKDVQRVERIVRKLSSDGLIKKSGHYFSIS